MNVLLILLIGLGLALYFPMFSVYLLLFLAASVSIQFCNVLLTGGRDWGVACWTASAVIFLLLCWWGGLL